MSKYSHSIDLCLQDKISGIGLPQDQYHHHLGRLAASMEMLEDPKPEFAAILRSLEQGADCGLTATELSRWQSDFDQVLVIGMGGSALGARTALSLRPRGRDADHLPQVHVFDDFDTDRLLRHLTDDLVARTALIIVSKSGGTRETLSMALVALKRMAVELSAEALSKACLAIAEPGDNALRKLANHFDFPALDHDPELGGRFSVFSETGMLPAALAGVDFVAIRKGGLDLVKAAQAATWPSDCPPAMGAAMVYGLSREFNVSSSVLLCYHPQLREFGMWYRQLWAESLGKEGNGTVPVRAMGPEDQHSQLQLYLDGPIDKFYTALAFNHAPNGVEIDAVLANEIGVGDLAGRRTGELMAAMQRGTIEALARRGRPVRTIAMQRFDEETLGALFMHFILETLFAADLWFISPFGQPAVEEGKKLAAGYLAGTGQ